MRTAGVAGTGLSCLLAGCIAYEPAPLDPLAILRELERAAVDPETGEALHGPQEGMTAGAAAAFAIGRHPALVAARAAVGIEEAQLGEAGRLADVMVSWSAMEVVAVEATGGTAKTAEVLAGLGVSWQVPRPGELGAQVGIAEADLDAARLQVRAAEWQLARSVYEAYLDVQAARARLDVNGELLEIARRIAAQLASAREAGGATAIQANLAAIGLASLEAERVRLEGDMRRARQRLNERLGLPPTAAVPLATARDPFAARDSAPDAAALVQQAVQRRPDLRAQLARYRAAEESLRLEVARQWPSVQIGTGLAIALPLFRAFNAPAIRTALARRSRAALELRSAVHTLRADVHAAVLDLENARRRVRAFEESALPRLRESLELGEEALRLGGATLLEVLTAQRQVLDVRTSYLDARIARARAELAVDTVSGAVWRDTGESEPPAERENEERR